MAGFISEADAAVLLAARDVARKLEQAARNGAGDRYNLGRFAETAHRADDAAFDVLNVAANYLDDPVAQRAVRS